MSEPTRVEEERAADAMLDGQIAELYAECRLPEMSPDLEEAFAPKWFDDPDECVAFARWYWKGALNFIGSAREILDYFEKPWLFNEEYAEYSHETH